MARRTTESAKPAVFSSTDPDLRFDAAQETDFAAPTAPARPAGESAPPPPARLPEVARRGRRLRWGAIFLSALTALIGLGASLAAWRLIEDLFARADWLGWTASGLAALAGLALLVLILGEAAGLLRVARVAHLHERALRAHRNRDMDEAHAVTAGLKRLYGSRRDLAWPLDRFRKHEAEIFDADDVLRFAERELMKGLDARAADEIARAARRVAVVTAVSPAALVDIGFVLYANLRLMRRLAALYGGRPGFFGLIRLGRDVVAHLALTGGIALGDSLLQQVLGHGLAARLSARLGEGVVNGLFTARIGLAALGVCRPLPFLALPPPALKQVMSGIAAVSETPSA